MKEKTGTDVVSGWGAISVVIGMSPRTAQRLTQCGLPVYKPGDRTNSTVYALRSELLAWVANDQKRLR